MDNSEIVATFGEKMPYGWEPRQLVFTGDMKVSVGAYQWHDYLKFLLHQCPPGKVYGLQDLNGNWFIQGVSGRSDDRRIEYIR